MFKLKPFVLAASLAMAASASFASVGLTESGLDVAVTEFGATPQVNGFNNFDGALLGDTAYSFTLGSGTYTFSLLDVSAFSSSVATPTITNVWLSASNDGSPANALYTFNLGSPTTAEGLAIYQPTGSWTNTFAAASNPLYLNVTGNAPDTVHFGNFLVTAAATVPTPVPEPATGAMLLAGLGLMGAMVRRRKLQD